MKEFAHLFMNDAEAFVMTMIIVPLLVTIFLSFYGLFKSDD